MLHRLRDGSYADAHGPSGPGRGPSHARVFRGSHQGSRRWPPVCCVRRTSTPARCHCRSPSSAPHLAQRRRSVPERSRTWSQPVADPPTADAAEHVQGRFGLAVMVTPVFTPTESTTDSPRIPVFCLLTAPEVECGLGAGTATRDGRRGCRFGHKTPCHRPWPSILNALPLRSPPSGEAIHLPERPLQTPRWHSLSRSHRRGNAPNARRSSLTPRTQTSAAAHTATAEAARAARLRLGRRPGLQCLCSPVRRCAATWASRR